VNININNTENVTLAIHSDSVPNGNWIELIGGTKIKIPSLNLIYNGTNASNYPTSNGNVNITLAVENNTDIKVKYPFSEHSMYTNVSGKKYVDIIFNGSSDFANQSVDIYLIKTTTTDIENTFTDIYNGNTTSFRNLLNSATKKRR
jgi:methanogen extracellular protein (TIGR04279 family)